MKSMVSFAILFFSVLAFASAPATVNVSGEVTFLDNINHVLSGTLTLTKEKKDKLEYKGEVTVTNLTDGRGQAFVQKTKLKMKLKKDGSVETSFYLSTLGYQWGFSTGQKTLIPESGTVNEGAAYLYKMKYRCHGMGEFVSCGYVPELEETARFPVVFTY